MKYVHKRLFVHFFLFVINTLKINFTLFPAISPFAGFNESKSWSYLFFSVGFIAQSLTFVVAGITGILLVIVLFVFIEIGSPYE